MFTCIRFISQLKNILRSTDSLYRQMKNLSAQTSIIQRINFEKLFLINRFHSSLLYLCQFTRNFESKHVESAHNM